MRQLHRCSFEGGMEKDSQLHEMAPGTYRDALNLEPLPGAEGGAMRIMPGELEIGSTLELVGQSYVAGIVEDREGYGAAIFVGGPPHQIGYYNGTSVVTLLKSGQLRFKGPSSVHSAAIIAGRYLYWTDARVRDNNGLNIDGEEPRKIDIIRHKPGKAIVYRLVFSDAALQDGVEFFYQEFDLFGTATGALTSVGAIPGPGPQHSIVDFIRGLYAAAGFTVQPIPNNTADTPATGFTINKQAATDVRIVFSTSGPAVMAIEGNFYPLGLTEEHLEICKPVPGQGAGARYITVDSPLRVDGSRSYQFRYRYLFDDGEKSAWGPVSRTPTNYKNLEDGELLYGENPVLNCIELDFTVDPLLNDAKWRVYIEAIEIAYRSSDDGVWRVVDIMRPDDYLLGEEVFQFFGAASDIPVASDEDGPADAQVLKNFDLIPYRACSLEAVQDERGNSIIALGGGQYFRDQAANRGLVAVLEGQLPTSIAAGPQESVARGLKKGGRYKVAVVHEDFHGRQAAAKFIGEIRVPFSDGKEEDTAYDERKFYYLSAQMLEPSPGLAYPRYRFALTKNLNQSEWWRSEKMIAPVSFYRFDRDSQELVALLNTERAEADYIGFAVLYDSEVEGVIRFADNGGQRNFMVPQNGDRVQIMSWSRASAWPGGTIPADHADKELYNYKVAGYELGDGVNGPFARILIDNDEASPDWVWANKVSVELYRPSAAARDQVYYEFGPSAVTEFGYSAISLLGYGDVFLSQKLGADYTVGATPPGLVVKESPSMHGDLNYPLSDHGRAVFTDRQHTKKDLFNIVRFSDVMLPGTKVNGLSSFRGANFFFVNTRFGPITKMVMAQDVLLVICRNKCQSVYVAKDRILDLSGRSQLGRSPGLFNLGPELKGDFGSSSPESVAVHESKVYAVDRFNGQVWEYNTNNGHSSLSHKGMKQFWQILDFAPAKVVVLPGAVDRSTGIYYISAGDKLGMYLTGKGARWVGFRSNVPDAIGNLNLEFLCGYNGKLYRKRDNVPRANFGGQQFNATVTVPFNPSAPSSKTPMSIEVMADQAFHVFRANVAPDANRRFGQRARMLPARFKAFESVFKADFARDELDPDPRFLQFSAGVRVAAKSNEGRRLNCHAMAVILQADAPELANVIREAYIWYIFSEQTIK